MQRFLLIVIALTILAAPLITLSRGTDDGDAVEKDTKDVQIAADQTSEPGASPAKMDRGTYVVRLTDLEGRVNRLKADYNQVRRRLALLAEKFLDRKLGGAHAQLNFRNEVGRLLKLERVMFVLDGELVFQRLDVDGDLAEIEEVDFFSSPVEPGDHVLSVQLTYSGQGFPYMDAYNVKVRSSHAFTVTAGQEMKIDVVGYEAGLLKQVTERPTIMFVEKISEAE